MILPFQTLQIEIVIGIAIGGHKGIMSGQRQVLLERGAHDKIFEQVVC